MTKWVESFRREEIRQEVRDDAAGRYDRDDTGTIAYRIKLYKLGLREEAPVAKTSRFTRLVRPLPWILGLLVLLPVSRALAQDPSAAPPEPPVQTVTGTVVS